MKYFYLLYFILFFTSCATTKKQETAFTAEEEEAFLNAEEEDLEDFEAALEEPDTSEDIAQKEEQEAEDELDNIETEFSEFINEEEAEEPIAEAEDDTLADGEDTLVAEEEADQPLTDETAITEEEPELSLEDTEEVIAEDTTNEEEEVTTASTILITNIRYENNNIYVDTNTGQEVSYRSRLNPETNQLIIEIPQAKLQDTLKWPYIMKEFQSDFALLQADQKTEDIVRIIVQMRPEASNPVVSPLEGGGIFIAGSDLPSSMTANNDLIDDEFDGSQMTNEVMANDSHSYCDDPEQILQIKSVYDFLLKEHQFCGHKITLDIRDTPLKEILYFLVEETNLNMIIDQNIPDSPINIRLREVPWDQALVLLMKQHSLAYTRKGNIIHIAQLNVFEQQQENLKKYKQFQKEQEENVPLEMEIVPVAYAEVGGIQTKIQIFKSPKGQITLDNENNALIIQDTKEALTNMKQLIKELDRPPKQVMIAAKIVEVNENFSRNLGVNFGFSGGSPFVISALGNLALSSASPFSFLTGSAPDAGTIGAQIKVGRFDFFGDLDAQLGLAESEGEVKVLSSPRIMALNRTGATVNQSSESISFSGAIGEGGVTTTQVQRSPVSLTLSVTPTITNVNSIYMQVSMNRSFEGARVGQGDSSAAPTNSRSASTRVLIKSGETIVIGGIYETQSSQSLLGFPILKYIPVVKWLFSQTNTQSIKTELLLFITPRIVEEESSQPIANKSLKKHLSAKI